MARKKSTERKSHVGCALKDLIRVESEANWPVVETKTKTPSGAPTTTGGGSKDKRAGFWNIRIRDHGQIEGHGSNNSKHSLKLNTSSGSEANPMKLLRYEPSVQCKEKRTVKSNETSNMTLYDVTTCASEGEDWRLGLRAMNEKTVTRSHWEENTETSEGDATNMYIYQQKRASFDRRK